MSGTLKATFKTVWGKDELTGAIEWRDLVLMVEGIMEQADSRKQRLETLKKLRKQSI